ncbi:MAG: F0F1 ATP synthase subunit epsilon [Pseudomonadota bacterium]|nr:F0F1 ATP synthase subunit epsilon [Pseudomonadota bacterium]
MADRITFELVSPARLLASIEADMVVVPGADGDFAILPGHAPIASTLRPGAVEVFVGNGDKPSERYFVAGGFAECALDTFTVLAETAIPMSELERGHIEQEIRDAREDIEDAKTDEKRHAAEERLAQLEDILQAL